VQGARQQLLASAALAQQQHGGVGRGNLFDRTAQAADRIAYPNDTFERHRAGALAQPPVLLLQLADAQRAAHDDRKHSRIEWLVIEVGRAEAYRGDRELARIVLGHSDDLGVGRDVEDLPQELEALRRHRRLVCGAEIEQHHIGLGAAHGRECLLGGFAYRDVEVGEHRLELTPQGAIVLEDQQLAALHRGSHQRAPLPNRTTSAVWIRMARSNNRLLFLM